MRNLLKTIIILLLLILPFAVTAQQDIYSSCEFEIFEDVKYFKLSSVASVHKLTLQWNDTEKSVKTSYNGKNIIFNTVSDIVYINNDKYYFGDIRLYNGYTYIPSDAASIFNEGYTAYLLNEPIEYKYINGKITKIDSTTDKMQISLLKKYDINQLGYFCVDEFAKLFNINPIKSVDNDYIMLRGNDHEIYFYPQTDYVYLDGAYFTAGDIIFQEDKFYAPDKLLQYLIEIFLPEFSKTQESPIDAMDNTDVTYTTYIFDNSNKKYVSMNEVSRINGYNFQWYYVNKYAQIKTLDSTYFILVPTNIIMKNDVVISSYSVKEEHDIVYIEYDALNIFGLIKAQTPKQEDVIEPSRNELVPLRQFADSINATVLWDDVSFSAIVTHQDVKYVFDIKNKKLFVQGLEVSGYEYKYENGITHVNTSIEELFLKKMILSEKKDTNDLVIIKGTPITVKTHYPLHNPERIVVDLLNAEQLKIGSINGQYFNNIRLLNDENGIKRIVFDLKDSCDYEIKNNKGYIEIKLMEKGVKLEEQSVPSPGVEKPKDPIQNEDIPKTTKNKASITMSLDKVNINISKYDGYEIKRISDPNRIVLFIPNAYSETKALASAQGSRYITSMNTIQDDFGLYIEIELTNQCRYELIKKSNTELVLEIYSQKILNMSYYNSSDRKYIMLMGMSLSDKYGIVNSNVIIENKHLITDISFIDASYRLTAGVLYINDDYIEKIQVNRNNEQVKITIYAKQPMNFYFNSEKSSYTNINLLPVNNEYEHCVVIDAGHGGYDPGAVAGTIYESTLNLSIAKKVEEILENNKIKVFMTRKTDEYVGLYERAHIANNLKASIFVSIHSNAFSNAGYKGIMTLVYPSQSKSTGLSGKSLGAILQKNMIVLTQAINRGVIDRPNLVVLKSTKMPAALVECGFMTNAEELAALQTDEYQDILAQSIAKGIMESLNANWK